MYSKNYLKKIGTLALAGVMAFSLAIPAFASGGGTNEDTSDPSGAGAGAGAGAGTGTATNQTVVSAKYQDVDIAVTVPTTGTAVVNPYGLPISFTLTNAQTDGSKEAKISGQQITTTPMAICNDGDIALTVGAKVTTSVGGNLTISTTKLDKTEKGNKAFVQLQAVAGGKNLTGDKADTSKKLADAIITESAKDATWESATSVTLDSTQAVTKDGLVTLAKSTVTTATDGTKTTTYNTGSVALVRLTGSCVEDPTTAWAETDTFTATIAYTFKPATT